MKGKGFAAAAITLIALGLAGCSSSSSPEATAPELTAPDLEGFTFEEAQLVGEKRGIEVEKIGPAQCVRVPSQGIELRPFPAEVEGQDVEPGQVISETPDGGPPLISVLLDCSPEIGREYFGIE
jgi:hypothetical protein